MFKLTRLGFMYLYLFLVLTALTPGATVVPDDMNTSISVVSERSREEQAVADHLAVKYSKPHPLMARIVSAAYKEGDRLQLSPLTLLAIMEKESSFRPSVVNFYGAVGLMQVVARIHLAHLSPETAVASLQQPETNIRVGATILSQYLIAKDGDMDRALRKYSGNAPGYSQKVLRFQDALTQVARTARA